MEEKTVKPKTWISFRVKPGEYQKIHDHFSKTTSRKLSEYARNILLKKPVFLKFRNQSADDFLKEMIGLRNELNAIGNNFNQAVKKLHTMSQMSEVNGWLLTANPMLQTFREKTEMIQEKLNQIYQQWSHESPALTA